MYCGYKIDKHDIHKTKVKVDANFNAPRQVRDSQIKAFLELITH